MVVGKCRVSWRSVVGLLSVVFAVALFGGQFFPAGAAADKSGVRTLAAADKASAGSVGTGATDRRVGEIERKVPSCAVVKKEIVTGTDRGGALTGYVSRGKVVKVALVVGLSHEDRQFAFYYGRDGKLMAATEVWVDYPYDEKRREFDFGRRKTVLSARTYFSNGRFVERRVAPATQSAKLPDGRKHAQWLVRASAMCRRALGSKEKPVDVEAWVRSGVG